MKIQIPKTFLGVEIEGSMERALQSQGKQNSQPVPDTPPIQAPIKERYIYVPTINLYVAKETTLHGLDWNKTQEKLHEQNLKMPTPYEFVEFLKYLKKDYQKINKDEADKILDEILTVRDPWRGEWLDAKFTKQKKWLIAYNKFDAGNILPVIEPLDKNTLLESKTPGINLEEYINNHTVQGLPLKNIPKGDLYYWSPSEDYVARFFAFSGRAGLYCDRNPSGSYSSLGVRVAKSP